MVVVGTGLEGAGTLETEAVDMDHQGCKSTVDAAVEGMGREPVRSWTLSRHELASLEDHRGTKEEWVAEVDTRTTLRRRWKGTLQNGARG